MRLAILAHGTFPDRAKTAVGVLRYGDDDVVAVLDGDRAGNRVSDHVPDVQNAPIVGDMAEAPPCDALLIGVAPIGGGFEADWRPDVRRALERGCDVIAGLHYLLAEDDEFATLAAQHGCELRDVREPPSDLSVADGTAGEVPAAVVLTVGTDCSTGKMTGAFELRAAARERGLDAEVVPTGQTGILIDGGGIAIDRVIADYAAGAVERLVRERGDADLLVVEGQGALLHPAYSGVTAALLHGARPDGLVLCHEAGREAVHGYEDVAIPSVAEYAGVYEAVAGPVSGATIRAGLLDTANLSPAAAGRALDRFEGALGVPATDPIRHDAADVLDAVLGD